jgi:hypothetical protein
MAREYSIVLYADPRQAFQDLDASSETEARQAAHDAIAEGLFSRAIIYRKEPISDAVTNSVYVDEYTREAQSGLSAQWRILQSEPEPSDDCSPLTLEDDPYLDLDE